MELEEKHIPRVYPEFLEGWKRLGLAHEKLADYRYIGGDKDVCEKAIWYDNLGERGMPNGPEAPVDRTLYCVCDHEIRYSWYIADRTAADMYETVLTVGSCCVKRFISGGTDRPCSKCQKPFKKLETYTECKECRRKCPEPECDGTKQLSAARCAKCERRRQRTCPRCGGGKRPQNPACANCKKQEAKRMKEEANRKKEEDAKRYREETERMEEQKRIKRAKIEQDARTNCRCDRFHCCFGCLQASYGRECGLV